MQIGDRVRVKAPFSDALPGVYDIEAAAGAERTWRITGGAEFHEDHLEVAE